MATSKSHVARLKAENELLRQAVSDAQRLLEIAAGELQEHELAALLANGRLLDVGRSMQ